LADGTHVLAVCVVDLHGARHPIEDVYPSVLVHLNVPDLPECARASVDLPPDDRKWL
jgi:hypothetical protein